MAMFQTFGLKPREAFKGTKKPTVAKSEVVVAQS